MASSVQFQIAFLRDKVKELMAENQALTLVIHSGFVEATPTTIPAMRDAITRYEAQLRELKAMCRHELNAPNTRYHIKVVYEDDEENSVFVYPQKDWTILKLKRGILEELGLLRGSFTKPDKKYAFIDHYANGELANNSRRVSSCLTTRCAVDVRIRAQDVPVAPAVEAPTVPDPPLVDANVSDISDTDGSDKGGSMVSDDCDDISISNYLPQSYLDDPSDFDPPHAPKPQTVWVDVKETKGRNLLLFRDVSLLTTVGELKGMIESEFGRKMPSASDKKPLTTDDFFLSCSDVKMENESEIGGFLEDEDQKKLVVVLVLVLRGGGITRGIRKHHTKEEATKALKARVVKNVCGEDDFSSLTIHEDLCPFVQRIEEQVAQAQMLHGNGHRVVLLGLRQCSEENLKNIAEVLSYSGIGRRGNSDERASRAIYYMFPAMSTVEDCTVSLGMFKNKTMASLLNILVSEYSVYYDNGLAVLKIEKLKEQVDDELRRRRDGQNASSALEGNGGCSVM